MIRFICLLSYAHPKIGGNACKKELIHYLKNIGVEGIERIFHAKAKKIIEKLLV